MRILFLLAAAAGSVAALRASRRKHENAANRVWSQLQRRACRPVAADGSAFDSPALDHPNLDHPNLDHFDLSTLDALPPPARRYLCRAIAPGTPLRRTLQLKMHGSIRLKPGGDRFPMTADQILAPPRGFVWKARVRQGPLRIHGFDRYADGTGVLRWWLYGLIPIVRGSGRDVDRSAAGRLAGEAILVPASLLPQFGVFWEPVDDFTARARQVFGGEAMSLNVTVDEEGCLQRVSFQRWRDDRGDGRSGYVRFDVDEFAHERTFDGYTIPTRFRAGWRLGEEDEYPFFYAAIEEATYL